MSVRNKNRRFFERHCEDGIIIVENQLGEGYKY